MAYLSSTSAKITPENYSARVKSITVRVCITNCTGILYITDILLQAGVVATGWVGHPCEMKWTLDGYCLLYTSHVYASSADAPADL